MVRFFTYSLFHGKDKLVGSDHIRAQQLIKYWPEAGLYKYGENPDVLIFQKVFASPDFTFPLHFEGIKILDICDPLWLEGYDVVQTCQAMEAVTCPTEAIAEFMRQFHDNVVVIPDRFDIGVLPEPKKHVGDAKTVVWFGYSHNAELLKPAMATIEAMGLNLIIISNDDPIVDRWDGRERKDFYTYIKYNEDSIYEDLQKADYAILPDGFRPEDAFKSNNKTIKANLAGLPVAKTKEDMELYRLANHRQGWQKQNYSGIKAEYDVHRSIEEYKQLIESLK